MKASPIATEYAMLFTHMAQAAAMGALEVRVLISPTASTTGEDYALTESDRSDSSFVVTLFPLFFDHDAEKRAAIFAHELAHMMCWPWANFAADHCKKHAREQLDVMEDNAMDRIARPILAACRESAVDFSCLDR